LIKHFIMYGMHAAFRTFFHRQPSCLRADRRTKKTKAHTLYFNPDHKVLKKRCPKIDIIKGRGVATCLPFDGRACAGA